MEVLKMSDYWDYINQGISSAANRFGAIGGSLWNHGGKFVNDNAWLFSNLPFFGNIYRAMSDYDYQQDVIRHAGGRTPAYPANFYHSGAMSSLINDVSKSATGQVKAMSRDLVDLYSPEVVENL